MNLLQETSENLVLTIVLYDTWDEMDVGSPMFLKHSDGIRTLRQSFHHFFIMITQMPKMCVHILWDSTVFVLHPFLYFIFGFFTCLFLHCSSFSPQNITCPSHGRNNHQLPLRRIVSASTQGRDWGKEAEFPLFQISPFHITHGKKINNTDSVQHRCIALQFQMIFLVCPLCRDLCTKTCSFKYRFINI